jgi:hypothetical protein
VNALASDHRHPGTPDLHRRLRFGVLSFALAALMATTASGAAAGESVAFSSRLVGNPLTGCLVAVGPPTCKDGVVDGQLVADGDPALSGTFTFKLPGVRARTPVIDGRGGRGAVRGELSLGAGSEPLRCTFRGRVRTRGIALSEGASVLLFHTGTFDARGECGGQRAIMKAIWSGTIGNRDGDLVMSFERFDGRLAGTIRLPDADVELVLP